MRMLSWVQIGSITNLLHFIAETALNLDKLLCIVSIRLHGSSWAGRGVRAMNEELREQEARLFRSLKEALEKSKALTRSCLA